MNKQIIYSIDEKKVARNKIDKMCKLLTFFFISKTKKYWTKAKIQIGRDKYCL